MLTKIFSFLRIDRKLLIGKNASIVITNASGTESTLGVAELALLDGLTASAAELNLTDGATYTVAEANYKLSDTPMSVTGTTATSATSASSQLIFLNAAGTTAIAHRFQGRAHITTTASGSDYGVVSAISAATNGSIGNITSGSFDFTTTVSGRLGINITNGTSTNYVSFTTPAGKILVSAPFVTS